MSSSTDANDPLRSAPQAALARPGRGRVRRHTLVARGEPMLWVSGGALVVCLTMILGMLAFIVVRGMPTFWPSDVVQIGTVDGRTLVGEIAREESYRIDASALAALPEAQANRARELLDISAEGHVDRTLLRTGNFELFNTHFEWVADFEIAGAVTQPEWTVVVERLEWGRFYGTPQAYAFLTPLGPDGSDPAPGGTGRRERAAEVLAAIKSAPGVRLGYRVARMADGRRQLLLLAPDELTDGDEVLAVAEIRDGAAAAWDQFEAVHDELRARWAQAQVLRRADIGAVNRIVEDARLDLRAAELRYHPHPAWVAAYGDLQQARNDADQVAIDRARRRLELIESDLGRPTADFLAVVEEVEHTQAEARTGFASITAEIEALERGVSRHVLHFTTARAGVDQQIEIGSIVRAYPANRLGIGERFGVYLDRWHEFLTAEPREANSEGGVFPAIFGTVLMTLIMCLVVVPFGVLAALYLREYAKAGPLTSMVRIAVNNLAGVPSIVFGVFGLGFFCYIVGSSIDELLFEPRLPQPTFGTGGLFWASLTLALMTAPVVIVATEEALAAVPGSMREGSYACGASKWQTIRRIVLPRAMPGIMTGAILAMARGAGEVAPLMLVGAAKLAPELPIDLEPPFGVQRSFMHLGFHIYDLGFQSQNSEAAKPMVFTTTLLLVGIVALLNLSAILLRSRLRRRFMTSAF